MTTIILDTETTGLTKPSFSEVKDQPFMTEIGLIVTTDTGEIAEEFSSLVNPHKKLSDEVIQKTGITQEMVDSAPDFATIVPRLRDIFYKAARLAAHNVTFDKSIVHYELLRAGCDYFPWPTVTIDTSHEYRHLFGFNPKLPQLYEKIMGKPLEEHHRALTDARTVYEIMKKEGWWDT